MFLILGRVAGWVHQAYLAGILPSLILANNSDLDYRLININ